MPLYGHSSDNVLTANPSARSNPSYPTNDLGDIPFPMVDGNNLIAAPAPSAQSLGFIPDPPGAGTDPGFVPDAPFHLPQNTDQLDAQNYAGEQTAAQQLARISSWPAAHYTKQQLEGTMADIDDNRVGDIIDAVMPEFFPGQLLGNAANVSRGTITDAVNNDVYPVTQWLYPGSAGAPLGWDNFSAALQSEPLPVDAANAELAKTHPILATTSKIAQSAAGSAPFLALGAAPAAVQKLIAAGFTADAIAHSGDAWQRLGTELGKNPEDRDMDALTSAASDIAQTTLLTPLTDVRDAGDFIESQVMPRQYVVHQLARQLTDGEPVIPDRYQPAIQTPGLVPEDQSDPAKVWETLGTTAAQSANMPAGDEVPAISPSDRDYPAAGQMSTDSARLATDSKLGFVPDLPGKTAESAQFPLPAVVANQVGAPMVVTDDVGTPAQKESAAPVDTASAASGQDTGALRLAPMGTNLPLPPPAATAVPIEPRMPDTDISPPATDLDKKVVKNPSQAAASSLNSARAGDSPASGNGPAGRLWTQSEFNGTRIYQRNDLIDHKRVDSRGRTNLQRMQRGLAPIGPDGRSINLHHTIQSADSPIAEMTATFHQKNSAVIHINPHSTRSGIDRKAFNKFRREYWKNRAKDFEL